MSALKNLFRFVISRPGAVPKLLRSTDTGVIFMLHRFPDPELGNPSSQDLDALRRILGHLRAQSFQLISLAEMFARAARGEKLDGAIAFTVDDGYRDHASVGARVFAEFDCPATVFLTTGFLDGAIWFWWDKIDYVFGSTTLRRFQVQIDESAPPLRVEWSTPDQRAAVQHAVTEACKRVTEAEKNAALTRLATAAEVHLPSAPPAMYGPMSWEDARACERMGISFGPHTVTHPILARTPDAQSKFEIEESWRRVTAEVRNPAPVFCYPNGQPGDYGEREVDTLRQLGLHGAVIGSSGYATGDEIRDRAHRFHVRRFSLPGEAGGLAEAIQYVTGIERVKERLRGRR